MQNSIAQDKNLSIEDSLNLLNRFSWRVIANREIVGAEEGSWITKVKYSESIRNVIGEAIADCVTKKNAFAGKTSNDVIKFEADPAKVKYSQANWNAVVLWNLVHVLSNEYNPDKNFDIEKAFNTVEERVKDEYSQIENIGTIVRTSIESITEYVNKLHFAQYFDQFISARNSLDEWRGRAESLSGTSKIEKGMDKKLTPALGLGINENAIKWFFESSKSMAGNTTDISVKDLEFKSLCDITYAPGKCTCFGKSLGNTIDLFVPLNRIIYCPVMNYKIKIDPTISSDQIMKIELDELWILDSKQKGKRCKLAELSEPLQKDILTVSNYIANGKAPADVESIYYEAKDGWHIKYKK